MMTRASIIVLSAVLTVAGCARTPPAPESNPLADAEQALAEAQSRSTVTRYAPVELEKARERLAQAREALGEGGAGREAASHYAYLAQRHAQIAMLAAETADAEAAAAEIERQREQLRLQMRNRAIDQQRREIDMLREQLAELKPRETERGIVLTIGNVLFAFDSASLNASAEAPLDTLADFLRRQSERRVRVEGHTDSVGPEDYNQRLSRERALSVAQAMVERGIARERMQVVGYGESRPVASNDTETGRQQNRRVEFVILDPGAQAGG